MEDDDGRAIRAWGYSGAALRIDTTTGELVGSWVPIPGEAEERLDFPTPAELCRCCGRVLLTSGSKFSVWFCGECGPRVTDLNDRVQRCVIPRARHSICNGVGTKPLSQWQDGDAARFIDDMRGLWDGMQLTKRWSHEIVRRNCAALRLDTDPTVRLSHYLDNVHGDRSAQRQAFKQMLDWWLNQPSANRS